LTRIKALPKRFQINNLLVDVDYSVQTKLLELSEEDAVKLLEEKLITWREGSFCLKSSKNLIPTEFFWPTGKKTRSRRYSTH
jgi:hypothetical protein